MSRYPAEHFTIIDPAMTLQEAQEKRKALEVKWDAYFTGTAQEGNWTYLNVAPCDDRESWMFTELDELIHNLTHE